MYSKIYHMIYTEYDFVTALKASQTPQQANAIMLKVNGLIHKRNRKVKRRSLKLDRVGINMVKRHHSSQEIIEFKSEKSVQALK